MILLDELRRFVQLQLIEEAGVVDLANRQNRLAVVLVNKVHLIVISTSDVVKHQEIVIPKVFGIAIVEHKFDGYYQLTRLYADTAVASIVLLAATLEYWERVIPDTNVSPAAQQVIKRYYNQQKDNNTLIDPNFNTLNNSKLDYLNAVYLGPVGFNIKNAFKLGYQAITVAAKKSSIEDVEDMLLDAALDGFDRAYDDNIKTKRTFDDLLNASATEDLIAELERGLRGGTTRAKTLAWLKIHGNEIQDQIEDYDFKSRRAWETSIQPALEQLNSTL